MIKAHAYLLLTVELLKYDGKKILPLKKFETAFMKCSSMYLNLDGFKR